MDELTVVVPVRDEGVELDASLGRWVAVLEQLGIDAKIVVYDDGSRDDEGRRLDALACRIDNIQVVHQTNAGHGPTLVRAYRDASSPWVLHVDGDDEIGPQAFASVWDRRYDSDIVIGVRRGRETPWTRRLISVCARAWVRVTFGVELADPNSPYRLMRHSAVSGLVTALPAKTCAPNIALAALAARGGLRVQEVGVQCLPRVARRSSLRSLELTRVVILSALQTAALALTSNRDPKAS